MTGLVPFNRKDVDLFDTGFGNVYNMLDDFFGGRSLPGRSLAFDTFKVDVQEDEKNYIVEADMPGIKKEEVEISFDRGRLSISVKREEKVEEEKKNYIHKERKVSSMCRSLYLENASGDDIKAKLDDGVLKIEVAKKEKSEAEKRIEIE
ncbi:Hsp20 family protein [Alkalibacter mobilis]|uniref:Hsp20 family protein n=1 Tax=Alkalibacter mobilis TaxID=2787712 RepID=UPI00189F9751|nr:Hsp20 family protein [Alkalibacter mobilis]MBF7096191.1 Hsp20 family protein [Alkalibacter mobilis]